MGAAPTIPDSNGVSFLSNLNAALVSAWRAFQTQDATAFTTTGTAPSFVLTPTPALASYTANQRLRVKFSAASASAPTLNVSGLGAKSLKVLTNLGTKINAVITSGALLDCEYDGTDFVVLNPVQPKNNGAYRNYHASCTGLSASIAMSCDLVTLRDANGGYIELAAVSLTLNTAGSGANGLDTGTLAISTWYNKYIIYNPTTGTVAALCSLSATAPTMPSGYTHWVRMGAFRTDASGSKYPLSYQWINLIACPKVAAGSNLTGLPVMSSGIQGSVTVPTWVGIAVAAFAPPTAPRIKVLQRVDSGTVMVAPNNAYGAYSSTTNPPPIAMYSSQPAPSSPAWVDLESTSIYFASSVAAGYLFFGGYEDGI